ncbi:hypothetical protein ABNG02_03125 [Halorubrum ejinorense]|uniref:Uncharacterized protein n=1 Tax=Halorubrum ejinorense TaxID=425309 RepID=A0AAV3SW33_9EURY
MAVGIRPQVSKYFLPALLAVAIAVTTTVFEFLGPVAGIKSGYVLLGLLFASLVYYTHTPSTLVSNGLGSAPYYGQVVLGVVALSIAAVAAASVLPFADPSTVRTGAILVGLPVGYTLLVLQIGERAAPDWLLTQILALFALDPITKVLSTDFYFGRGDIPKHVRFAELVATTGTWRSIPETTLYHFFPGLQTLVGSVSLLSGLSTYDSLVATGIITYLVVVVVAYLLAGQLFDDPLLPICVALGVSALGPIHRYSVYFFPQSLAVGLALVVVLAAYRFGGVPEVRPGYHLLVASPIVVALWFTHHLTVVLFAPLVFCLVAIPAIAGRVGFDDVRGLGPLPLAAWIGGSIAYWLLTGVFIQNLINDVRMVVGQGQVSDTDAGAPIVSLGAEVPEPLVGEALRSLLSVGAVYNVLLVCVFSLGALLLFERPNRYRSPAALLVVGLSGAGLMIRTPIDIHGLARTQLVVSVFVAFVVAVTLHRLLPLSSGSIRKAGPALLIVVLLATSGPASAADDLYGLHSGPDLWETRTTPETQKEFSAAEMEGFRLTASFADRNEITVGTDWNSEIGLSRYRYGLAAESFAVEEGRITTDRDVILYRQRWVDRSVRLVPERTSFVTLLISDGWFDRMVETENKVYTTGDLGMIADHSNATSVDVREPQ